MPTPRLAAAFGLALFISLAVPSAALASDPAPLQGDPTTAFGITDGGVLNMFDIETGRVLSSAGGQTLDADYSTVRGELFWATTKNGQDIINSVPWGSTRPSGVVARGRRVTVSPDGHLLAYSYDPDGPAEGSLPETIAVRN
ncbi:MAG: hypothetical protein ACRDYV_10660, partial [Acidimicrobiia bacterium]